MIDGIIKKYYIATYVHKITLQEPSIKCKLT